MFSSFSLGLYETVASCGSKGMLGWNPSTLRSFIILLVFCPWFLLCSLQTISDVITAKQLYRRHMFGNPPFSLSWALSHTTSPTSLRISLSEDLTRLLACQNCHYLLCNLFFPPRLCSLWNYLQKELQTTQAFIPIRVRKAFAPYLWVSQALHPLWHPRVPH